MASSSKVQIIITLKKPDLDEQELEGETQKLYRQLLNLRDLEQVERVRDTTPLEGAMGGPYLPRILKAEAEASNLKDAIENLQELSRGQADLKIVSDTKEVTLEASNRSLEELSENIEEKVKQVLA